MGPLNSNDQAIEDFLKSLGISENKAIRSAFLEKPKALTQDQDEKWEGSVKVGKDDFMHYRNLIDDRLQIKINETNDYSEKRKMKALRIGFFRLFAFLTKFQNEYQNKKEAFQKVKESVKPEAYKEGYRFPVDTGQMLIFLFFKKENQSGLFDPNKPLDPIRQDDFKDYNEFVRNPTPFIEEWLNGSGFSLKGNGKAPFQESRPFKTITRLEDDFPESLNFSDKQSFAEHLNKESIEDRLASLEEILAQGPGFSLPTKEEKSLPGFLNHPYPERLVEELRKEFSAERGLTIRYMIEGLKKRSIVFIENRQRKAVYNAIKSDFESNIGSYQSVFPGMKYDLDWNALIDPDHPKNPDYQEIESRLTKVLNKLSDK